MFCALGQNPEAEIDSPTHTASGFEDPLVPKFRSVGESCAMCTLDTKEGG